MKKLLLLAVTLVVLITATIPMAVPVLACDAEGLTPGYWKNHEEAWHVYSPGDDFDTVFGTDAFDPDVTLMQALNLEGGQLNALARHVVAALLNAADPDITYLYTVQEIISALQVDIDGDWECLKDLLDEWNNAGVVDGDD